MTHSLSKWAVAALVCSTAAGAHAALDVRLGVAKPVVVGDVDVHVNVTVTNTGRQPMRVNKAQLPSERLQTALFRISRDGLPVDYVGPMVKRGRATEADFVTLDAGASLTYNVELTQAYDLAKNGRYAIEYVGLTKQQGNGGHGLEVTAMGGTSEAVSDVGYVWLEGRTELPLMTPAVQSLQVQPMASSITYTGNCSASQKTTLASAVAAATTYSQNSYNYLNSTTPGNTSRYKTWFGSYTSSRWSTAKTHYQKTLDAFKNKPLTLDCSCRDSYYAYVYPNQPYKIYVCNAFWSAPMTGTDSKAGTLVHEMTHFNVVAGTDDHAYGHSAAKSLALSNPTKALDNADSHEYFSENSPPLP